jgi:hypothetical protein
VHRARAIPDLDALPQSAILTDEQVAGASGFARITLQQWRAAGRGPRVVYVEGRPRYTVADVRDWLAGRLVVRGAGEVAQAS